MGNLACSTHGAAMVIPAPGFDPAKTLQACQDERVHLALRRPDDVHRRVVAAELRRLRRVDHPHRDHGRLAVPGRADEEGHRVGHRRDDHLLRHDRDVTGVDADPHRRLLRATWSAPSAGSARTWRSRSSTPSTGETLPRGEPGEFCTKGYSVMLGYWEQQEKTDEVLEDGWMHTGDIAVMGEDGYVQITGRIKDMVIRGGENIYPREIEEFLYTHPDILDAQVIGVPDERYGEELCAWVRMRDGRRAAHRRRRPRVRHRQARALQDPALRPDRRRVPDDRDRQGAQGRDAGEVRRRPRAGRPAVARSAARHRRGIPSPCPGMPRRCPPMDRRDVTYA